MERKDRRSRLGLIAVGATVVAMALAAPTSSQAAVTIGQVNPVTPAGGGSCDPNVVYTQKRSAGAVRDVAPSDGVITSWATKATDTPGQQVALKTISQTGDVNPTFTVQATSAVESLTPSSLNRFATRVPIRAGQRIGYFFSTGADDSQACTYNGVQNANEVGAGPSNGQSGSAFTDTLGSAQKLLNLEATIEADADADGFGDETQDRCLGQAGGISGCRTATVPPLPGSDTKEPTLGTFRFSRTVFKAAGSGSAFTSRKKRKSRAPTGTKVAFNLSEAASVRFTVQRKKSGRRSGGRCRTKTRKNRKKSKCTLWKSVRGSFTVPGEAGRNTFTFRGRIGGRALSAGSYRLSGVATDSAKNASDPERKGFRIVR